MFHDFWVCFNEKRENQDWNVFIFFVVVAVSMHHLAKIYPAEVTAGLVAMNIALMFNSKV